MTGRLSLPRRACCAGDPRHHPTCILHGSLIRAKAPAFEQGRKDAEEGVGLADDGQEAGGS